MPNREPGTGRRRLLAPADQGSRQRITMLLENNPYPRDVRVRNEAESLVAAGHREEVVAPRAAGPMLVGGGSLANVRLAYVGAIAGQDGVEGTAEVLACMRDRVPSLAATLTIVGDGSGRSAVEAARERLGVSHDVTIIGWVPPAAYASLERSGGPGA